MTKNAVAEFGVGLKSESFTPWITPISLNNTFGPGPADKECWIPGLAGCSQLLTVTLQTRLASRVVRDKGWSRGRSCRVQGEPCQDLILCVCVLRAPKDSSPCWDSAEPRGNVLLFSPKCGVGPFPGDQQCRCCGV